MQIQVASDLHLEYLQEPFPGHRVIEPARGAEVLVLAGDIHNGLGAVYAFADWPVPVLLVPGNHEYYGSEFGVLRSEMKRAARGTSVHVLDNDCVVIGGVRFLGATMWTDYRLLPHLPLEHAMALAGVSLADHTYILTDGGELFSPADAAAEHWRSRRWLQEQLLAPHAGPTVVVTHHGCNSKSTAPRFAGSNVNPAFMSDLSGLMGPDSPVALWVHGHVHNTCDYKVNGTRVVTNPRGYALNRNSAPTPRALRFENPDFIAKLVIDLGSGAGGRVRDEASRAVA